MNYIIFFIILAVLSVIVIPCILIRWKVRREVQDSFWWLVKNGGKMLPYSVTEKYGMGKGLIYCPHPFTNWSLNPTYLNKLGESIHTVEGFRKTREAMSIMQVVQENPSAYRVVCVGGSSTYCTEIERYQDTWPAQLQDKLSEKDVVVFNFGVGGWGTIQSLIRCSTWLPIIQPKIVVIYQAKNDLTPLYNGTEKEKAISPDYQNIMAQFSDCISFRFPRWSLYVPLLSLLEIRKLKRGLLDLYKPKPWADPRGLERLDKEVVEGILFRTEALINMCKMIKCKVLYIPEIVIDGEYAVTLDKIYDRIPEVINKYNNTTLFEMKGVLPETKHYFMDKMHLNKKGCEIFAEIVARQIREML